MNVIRTSWFNYHYLIPRYNTRCFLDRLNQHILLTLNLSWCYVIQQLTTKSSVDVGKNWLNFGSLKKVAIQKNPMYRHPSANATSHSAVSVSAYLFFCILLLVIPELTRSKNALSEGLLKAKYNWIILKDFLCLP